MVCVELESYSIGTPHLNMTGRGFPNNSAVRCPDSNVHGANIGPTWAPSAPDGPHVGPMNLAIREVIP